jgi:tight adherence protein C
MTHLMWGVLWAAIVAVPAWTYRPAPARLRALGPTAERPRSQPRRPAPARFIGRAIRLRLGRGPDAHADRRLGWALIAAFVVLPLSPLLAPAAAAAAWAAGAWRARSRRRRQADLVRRALPEVVDLFVVAIGAGLTVPLALREVGPLAPSPFGAAIEATVSEIGLGMRTADALESFPLRLGETVRPLSAALMASERYGVPLGAALERLADEVRRDRRRHAEAAARRVPVKLLFPLVFCSLPALALLSVAPLIAGALRALRM